MLSGNKYLVSAIISTYNSEEFIRGKIDDLLNQTLVEKLEIIIINSNSSQNEDMIVKGYLSKFDNIKYIRTLERETIYKAWNRGIQIASGKYITNSNTDDRLKKDAFEILAGYLDENENIGLIYTDQIISHIPNQTFDQLDKKQIIKFPEYNHLYQLERCIIGSQPMWRADIHLVHNIWFDESFEVCGDHDFQLKVARQYEIKHISVPLGVFYKSLTKSNKEYQNLSINKVEVKKIQEKHIEFFLENLREDELQKIYNKFHKFLVLPLPVLYILKWLFSSHKKIYPKYFFHSPFFIYFFSILIQKKLGNIDKASSIAKRVLRYRKSERINEEYEKLKRSYND